ncbi:ABC transporter ATP-binding protein [Uliginosibacterium sp. H1]|uniref:ABC transporter ATP-binding protein n=1 Tax=Uliginosibacterium sp. H1 TaxID=3114757 RepID=UPI002E1712A0|nr:ABC transporter ATP-binding protein [Uliginosibacterium sp. H1]
MTHPSDPATSSPPLLDARQLRLGYGTTEVVHDVSFQLQAGSIACLLGPSGCGKTTILRSIAGFERLWGGSLQFDGKALAGDGLHVPAERRRIGMVFQDYALFPHLSITDNLRFGLRGLGARDRAARVQDMLRLVGLLGQGDKYPHELSGGQQQRVALARALAPQPQLILLDEPFSNLDVDLRERLSAEVRDILKTAGTSAILVTHDQHEAFAMADEIGVMHAGRIQQWDSAYRLYHLPANRFVADFVGQGVFVPGTPRGQDSVEIELGLLRSRLPVEGDGTRTLDVLLRPDDVVHDDASPLRAEVLHKAFRGAQILYTLRLASGTRVLSLVPSHHNHALGERIGIRLDVDHVVTFSHTAARPVAA